MSVNAALVRRRSVLFPLLAAMLATSSPADAHSIRGNVVLGDSVYLSLLKLPPGRRVGPRYARNAARRVEKFLVDAGYELATVTASVSDDGELFLIVDEGRLEKIILPGQSGLAAAAFQVMLDLPDKVFNRYKLDAEIARLHQEYGLTVDHYTVAKTETSSATFPKLAELTASWVPAPANHRLEVHLLRQQLSTGVALHLAYESPDGLQTGLGYRARGPFSNNSRVELMPVVGLRVQDALSDAQGRRFVSRAELAARYYSPPLDTHGKVRLILEPRIALLNRQRLDLGVRSYDQLLVDPSVLLVWKPLRDFEVEMGAGVSVQRIYAVNGETPMIMRFPTNDPRPFLSMSAEIELARSKSSQILHELEVDGRVLFTPARNTFAFDVEYEASIARGWDLIEVEVMGSTVLGDVPFTRERSVGRFLRGVYGTYFFTNLGGGVAVEYQFSLARDLYRLGVFHDGVAFRYVDPDTGQIQAAFADSFGVGLHHLLLDTFEVGAYFAVGFNTVGQRDQGISIALSQVF